MTQPLAPVALTRSPGIAPTRAIYLFHPEQHLLVCSAALLKFHRLQQRSACLGLQQLLRCYSAASGEKLHLALKVAGYHVGTIRLALATKGTSGIWLEHHISRLCYGDRVVLCGDVKILHPAQLN